MELPLNLDSSGQLPIEPQVLFENEHVLIIFKPANFLSTRPRFHNEFPEPNVLDYFSSANILPLHRLDFEVAGLMLLAKNKDAQREISAYFEKRTLKKSYWALTIESDLAVFGKLPFRSEKLELAVGKEYHWESKILRGKKRSYSSPAGDIALTKAKFLGSENVASYRLQKWELSPLTGRSHQLRFELARHSQPIVADELYFAPLAPQFTRGIALFAVKLDFSGCTDYQKLGLPHEVALSLEWKTIFSQVRAAGATSIAARE